MKTSKHLITALATALVAALWTQPTLALDSAKTGYWDEAATWGGSVPTVADNVIIKPGHTVTIRTNGVNYAQSLTIETNGVLTHTANTTTALGERYKVVLDIVNNLTVDRGGQINVDAKGYQAGNGPGKPLGPGTAGAGHGGIGGNRAQDSGTPGTTYGSITAPTNCGSGAGRAGGGAVVLVVNGVTTMNGAISAGGLYQSASYGYGSGGSVFLTTGTLAGNGTLRANGGGGGWAAGGGGRVAVILTDSVDFGAVKMQAYAGGDAAGGTVYLQTTNHAPGQGKLIVDYNDIAPGKRAVGMTLQNGTAASSYAFSEIILTNGGVYALDSNDTLDVGNTIIRGDATDAYDGLSLIGGTLTCPGAFACSNYFITVGAANTAFNLTSLTVGAKVRRGQETYV